MRTIDTRNNLRNRVYDNELLFVSLQSFLARKKRAVVSNWTAATFWGFSPIMDTKLYIIVPRGYNPILPKGVVKKQTKKINDEVIEVTYEGDVYKMTSLEKTFIDLIKSFKGEYTDVRYEMVRSFKKTDYNTKKLLQLAKAADVFGEVSFMIGFDNE